jgi:hypothetical protein
LVRPVHAIADSSLAALHLPRTQPLPCTLPLRRWPRAKLLAQNFLVSDHPAKPHPHPPPDPNAPEDRNAPTIGRQKIDQDVTSFVHQPQNSTEKSQKILGSVAFVPE